MTKHRRQFDPEDRIAQALAVAMSYGNTDGAHHKQWAIDQMVRALLPTKAEYEKFVAKVRDGTYGDTYVWSVGIPP